MQLSRLTSLLFAMSLLIPGCSEKPDEGRVKLSASALAASAALSAVSQQSPPIEAPASANAEGQVTSINAAGVQQGPQQPSVHGPQSVDPMKGGLMPHVSGNMNLAGNLGVWPPKPAR